MSKCLNLIKSYRQTREDVEFELWYLGTCPVFHSPEWFEKLKKYRELKAKKKENTRNE